MQYIHIQLQEARILQNKESAKYNKKISIFCAHSTIAH